MAGFVPGCERGTALIWVGILEVQGKQNPWAPAGTGTQLGGEQHPPKICAARVWECRAEGLARLVFIHGKNQTTQRGSGLAWM